MAKLKILEFPDPRLRKKAAPVEAVDDELRKLIDDMFETMYAAPGIGLAATQVARLAYAYSSHGLIGPTMGPVLQNRESGQDSLTSRHPDTGPVASNVVVGLGNDIAADDGAGIATARLLEAEFAGRADVDVIALPWAGERS